MNNWTNKSNKTTWMAAAAAAIALAIPAAAQNNTLPSLVRVHGQAADANSPAKHAEVARHYRLHAESLNAQAAAWEQEAAELTRASGAPVLKWPGLASGQLQDVKTSALEARRAALETMALADHHLRMAVETQANGPVVAGN